MTNEAFIKAAEILPSGFNQPSILVAATAVAAGAIALDRYKARLDSKLTGEDSLAIADPESAEQANLNNRRSAFRNRANYYLASLLATTGLIQLAGPYSSHEKIKGEEASIVINSDLTANTTDIAGGKSRLQASVDGVLNAVSTLDMPVSIILSGNNAALAVTMPPNDANTKQADKKINAVLSNSGFRNGNSLSTAVSNGLNVGTEPEKDVIVIDSSLSNQDQTGILAAESSINSTHAKDSIDAIVVGNSTSSQAIGAVELSSPVELASFRSVLGPNNIKTAGSTLAVQKDIESFVGNSNIIEQKNSIEYLDELALVLAAAFSVLGVQRRLAGIRALRKLNVKGGK